MMTKNMNNYIGKVDAEWVDPAVELPPDEENDIFTIRMRSGEQLQAIRSSRPGKWFAAIVKELVDDCQVVAWLRIGGPSTAIPMEQVQAAVDRIGRSVNMPNIHPEDHAITKGMHYCLFALKQETGVTPSEVPHD
jgi:hypothetical protein